MGKLFKDRYRIDSNRHSSWNYAGCGAYFITICTHDRIQWFGNVKNEQMRLSGIGKTVFDCWQCIPEHFLNIQIDTFVVMPDHVHGIVVVGRGNGVNDDYRLDNGLRGDDGYRRDAPWRVSTTKNVSKTSNVNERTTRAMHVGIRPLKHGSLSSVVNHFKGAVKRWCNKNGCRDFRWQPNYYDAIIRDDVSLQRIRQYIIDNPRKWNRN